MPDTLIYSKYQTPQLIETVQKSVKFASWDCYYTRQGHVIDHFNIQMPRTEADFATWKSRVLYHMIYTFGWTFSIETFKKYDGITLKPVRKQIEVS